MKIQQLKNKEMRNWLIQEQLLRKSNPHFQLIESADLEIDTGWNLTEFPLAELVSFRKSTLCYRLKLDGILIKDIIIERELRHKIKFKIIKRNDISKNKQKQGV